MRNFQERYKPLDSFGPRDWLLGCDSEWHFGINPFFLRVDLEIDPLLDKILEFLKI
jgi:hypothetical protein